MDNDLISRAAIKKEIDKLEKEEHSISPSWFLGLDDCRDIVDCIPAVDAVPVRYGHWINRDGQYECSECHNISCCRANYCPDCGSMMIEGEQNATDRR